MAVTRVRDTTDDLPGDGVADGYEGLNRRWLRYTERRVTARGAARLRTTAKRRMARERRQKRGRDLLNGVVDVARVTEVAVIYPIKRGEICHVWNEGHSGPPGLHVYTFSEPEDDALCPNSFVGELLQVRVDT